MQIKTIKVIVPANYVGDIEKDAKIALAIELFRRGIISVGRAAEIAGMSLQDFLYELRVRNIKAFIFDEEDILEELFAYSITKK